MAGIFARAAIVLAVRPRDIRAAAGDHPPEAPAARLLSVPVRWNGECAVHGSSGEIRPRFARPLSDDRERRYGYRPRLLATLADARRFAGACCRAAGWIELGAIRGCGRMDRHAEGDGSARRLALLYPLCRDVQQRLRQALPRRHSETGAGGRQTRLVTIRFGMAEALHGNLRLPPGWGKGYGHLRDLPLKARRLAATRAKFAVPGKPG